jgi:hypothetical protein
MQLFRRLALVERLAALAGLVAGVASLAGFVPGFYRDTHTLIAQSNGQDAATIVFCLPLLAVGLVASSRGSTRGRIVVLGALMYLLYTYAVYAFVGLLGPSTILQIAIVGLSAWALLITLAAPGALVDDADAAIGSTLARRTSAVFMLVVAALFAVAWLGQIAGAVTSGVRPQAFIDAGWPTSPIYTLDLAFVLPLMTVTGWFLIRHGRGAAALAGPLLVFMPILCLGVLTMSVFAAFDHQPFDIAMATIFVVIAVAGAALAARALLPITARRPAAPQSPHRLNTHQATH